MANEFVFVQLSSLNKVFLNEKCNVLSEINSIVCLKGERVSYQILYKGGIDNKTTATIDCVCDEKINIKMRTVGNVPSFLPARRDECDDYYLSVEPGLFPDVLYPIENGDKIEIVKFNSHSLFITAEIPEDLEAGNYSVAVRFIVGEKTFEKVLNITVLNEKLPQQKLTYTQWFHADCIASYYNYEILSEEHWQMIEKFIKMAVYTGINMLLTPIFTLALDTEVGLERPTLQLVDVYYKNGKYSFGFDKLKRWIDISKKCGVKKFEMSHLFTQWGTGCTPKIMAQTDEGIKKIFGWHTKAVSYEYKEFLNAFIPELCSFLKSQNVYDDTYFHISDEPDYERHFDIYKAERQMLKGLVEDDKFIEACSDYRLYEEGIVNLPVAITDKVDEFFEHGHKDIWTYYCCGPCNRGYSNRFLAMPGGRNRIIGFQLYKYNIYGFLHWGYNFYYSQLSKRAINPFLTTDADEAFQSGDAYTVYPGENGPLESLRSVVFYEGIQDISACLSLEKYIGREAVLNIINEDGEIRFNEYPRTDDGVLNIRNRINTELMKHCK